MSILIKGKKMPKSCPCEIIGVGYDLFCSFAYGVPSRVQEYYECCENGTRPDWCPLVSVPPYGRLIDADELEYHADNVRDPMGRMEKTVMWEKIKAAPTIIPADEGGET